MECRACSDDTCVIAERCGNINCASSRVALKMKYLSPTKRRSTVWWFAHRYGLNSHLNSTSIRLCSSVYGEHSIDCFVRADHGFCEAVLNVMLVYHKVITLNIDISVLLFLSHLVEIYYLEIIFNVPEVGISAVKQF